MNRLLGWLAALGGFCLLILTFGRSKKKEGRLLERTNQLGDALENVEDAKRIQENLDNLDPAERRKRLREHFSRP